jgi:hypothetical protein
MIILTPGNDAAEPAAGIWIKRSLHEYGYGRQAIATSVAFAVNDLASEQRWILMLLTHNGPSRRLAESPGGRIITSPLLRKIGGVEYPEIVYRIPAASFD